MSYVQAVKYSTLTRIDIYTHTHLCSDVVKVEAGIGDKVGTFLQFMSMCLCGFIIGFVKGWKLTLVILAVTPVLGLSGMLPVWLGAPVVLLKYRSVCQINEDLAISSNTCLSVHFKGESLLNSNEEIQKLRTDSNGDALGVNVYVCNPMRTRYSRPHIPYLGVCYSSKVDA